jgi:uncharacterized protein
MNIEYNQIFPSGVATKEAFCNRDEERRILARNIKSGRHTLLVAPRRYGKSSLVKKVIDEQKVPSGEADLFVAIDEHRVQQRILSGVNAIIKSIKSPVAMKLEIVAQYFYSISSKLTVGVKGLQLTFDADVESDPATNILDILSALEVLLKKKNKKAVLFIDEIQIIGKLKNACAIEGAIRSVAQTSTHLCLVFSGSRRHLVNEMFNDDDRPLYKLCEQIALERISAESYQKHLSALSVLKWPTTMPPNVIEHILSITKRHPYYVNRLCFELWQRDKMPGINDVETDWARLLHASKAGMLSKLDNLSRSQLNLLIYIAKGHNGNLMSKAAITELQLSASSIADALKHLTKNDILERGDNNYYTVLDPMISYILDLYY